MQLATEDFERSKNGSRMLSMSVAYKEMLLPYCQSWRKGCLAADL